MGNALNRDLVAGEIVRIKRKFMKPEFKSIDSRRVKVLDGFGMHKDTRGTALFVEFVCDGERCRYEGDQIEEDTSTKKKAKKTAEIERPVE